MSPLELYGLVLSGSVLVVALLLLGWHRAERRLPAENPSEEDRAYLFRQDRRRRLVAAIMVVLAALILIGSSTPHLRAGRPNPLFLAVWLLVFGLVLLLLVLGLVDWVAIRGYARRQRGALLRERMDLLKQEAERHGNPPTNGRGPSLP